MLRARVFVCGSHADLVARPWDGGDLFDFDAIACTPGARDCSCELVCAAGLADGVWMVANDPECFGWSRLDDAAGATHARCRQRHDVQLEWVRPQLEALEAAAHPCAACGVVRIVEGPEVCSDCWKTARFGG